MPRVAGRTAVRVQAEGDAPAPGKHGGLTYDKSKALAGDINSGNYR